MGLYAAKTVGSKKISVRRHPDIPGDLDVVETLDLGETIRVDTDDILYDWTGRMYYKVMTLNYNEGYIDAEAVGFVGVGGRNARKQHSYLN